MICKPACIPAALHIDFMTVFSLFVPSSCLENSKGHLPQVKIVPPYHSKIVETTNKTRLYGPRSGPSLLWQKSTWINSINKPLKLFIWVRYEPRCKIIGWLSTCQRAAIAVRDHYKRLYFMCMYAANYQLSVWSDFRLPNDPLQKIKHGLWGEFLIALEWLC